MANCELAVTDTPQTRFRIASVLKQFTQNGLLGGDGGGHELFEFTAPA